jgi:hypothetical protein
MRFRWLAAFPLLYAAVFIAISWSLGGGEALAAFAGGQKILVRLLAIVGCFLAVSAFERGDHLRAAWLWLGAGSVLILLRDLLRFLPPFQPAAAGPGAQTLVSGLGILSNVALLIGIWMLARSWRMAAIMMPGGRSGFVMVALIAAALAVAVAGPGAYKSALAVAHGDGSSLIVLVSAVVDILSLCLISPLLLTAVSLRGGLFSWPWGLITASRLAWLLYDAAVSFAPPGRIPLDDLCRGLGQNYLFAAGVAQLLVVRQVRRRTLKKQTPLSKFFQQSPLGDLDLERDKRPLKPGPE